MNISASTAADSFQHSFFGGFQFVCCAWHCDPKLVTHIHIQHAHLLRNVYGSRARTGLALRLVLPRHDVRPSVRPHSGHIHFQRGSPGRSPTSHTVMIIAHSFTEKWERKSRSSSYGNGGGCTSASLVAAHLQIKLKGKEWGTDTDTSSSPRRRASEHFFFFLSMQRVQQLLYI